MPPFLLLDLANGTEITGDTRSEIVDQVVAGHADPPEGLDGDTARFELRLGELIAIANRVQALAMSDVDPSELDEEVLTALFHDRATDVVEVEDWPEGLPPLVLIATNYAPYSEVPAPEGNVVLLDPKDETTFLESVVRAGIAQLYVYDGEEDEDVDADFA